MEFAQAVLPIHMTTGTECQRHLEAKRTIDQAFAVFFGAALFHLLSFDNHTDNIGCMLFVIRMIQDL